MRILNTRYERNWMLSIRDFNRPSEDILLSPAIAYQLPLCICYELCTQYECQEAIQIAYWYNQFDECHNGEHWWSEDVVVEHLGDAVCRLIGRSFEVLITGYCDETGEMHQGEAIMDIEAWTLKLSGEITVTTRTPYKRTL